MSNIGTVNRIDTLQYILGVAFLLTGIYLLWANNSRPSRMADVGESDGVLSNPINQVRWKSPLQVDWNNVFERTGVRYGDSIFTGSSSHVDLQLQGITLGLSANTLMVLRDNKQAPLIKLDSGTLQLTMSAKQKRIMLEVGGEKIDLSKKDDQEAQFSFSYAGSVNGTKKKIALSLTKGQVNLSSAGGKKIDLHEGQIVVLNKVKDTLKFKRFEFRLEALSKKAYFLKDEILPIGWSWDDPKVSKIVLNTSRSPEMKEPEALVIDRSSASFMAVDNKTPDGIKYHYKIPLKLNSGQYYLQLRTQSSDGVEVYSNVLPVNIVELRAPLIYDYGINFLSPTDSKVGVHLEQIPFVESYEVAIFRGSETVEPFQSKVSKSPKIEYFFQEHGHYSMRARYKLEGTEVISPWTDYIALNVPPPLKTPELGIGKYNFSDEQVLVQWKPVAKATYYEIIGGFLRGGEKSKDPLRENKVWRTMLPGQSQTVHVIARNEAGQRSNLSEPLLIPGFLPAPQWIRTERLPAPLVRYDREAKPSLELEWAFPKGVKISDIELADNANFFRAKKIVVNAQRGAFPFDFTGKVFVRVREHSEDPNLVGKYSEVVKLEPPKLEPMDPPQLELPKKNETMLFIKKYGAAVQISWSACARATSYDLEIAPNEGGKGGADRSISDIKKTEYLLKQPQEGSYRWRVRCQNRYNESKWSSFQEFNVTYGN